MNALNTAQAAPHQSIARLLRDSAVQSPGSTAIVDSDVKLTYQQLHQQVGLIALRLREYGLRAEEVVGVYLHRSANQIAAMLGVLKAGAACLPLDTSEPPLRLKAILEDCNHRVLITERSLKDHLRDSAARLVFIDDLPQRLEEGEPVESDGLGEEVNADSLAFLVYQSSPMGRPAGVMITHGMLSRLASARELQIEPSDRVGYVSTLWQQGWLAEVFAPLAAGATVVILPNASSLPPRKFAALLRDNRLTILSTHSAALRRLAKEFPWAINSVRIILCNDRPEDGPGLIAGLKADILQRVSICYGALEVAGCWALQPLSRLAAGISEEYLTTGTKLFLLDDSCEPVAPEATGHLYIQTSAITKGYHRSPVRTAESFIPNPFSPLAPDRLYRSGELAGRMPDGAIHLLGRQDGLILHHGMAFYPQEIEAALLSHPAVSQAAVMSKGGSITAFLVGAPGHSPAADDLKLFLKQIIPEPILPSSFTFVEDLPRSPSGELDRNALVDPDAACMGQTPRTATRVAPSNDIEHRLAQIWTEVLDVPEPGIHDSFTCLGVPSLLATQMVARISDTFKLHLSLKQLFEAPTIAGLAKVIQQLSPAQGTQAGNSEGEDIPHTISYRQS
jgi:acyl-coenzyme A synthetase/AMP-(fatty) acid ligase/acyl carrier protein